MDRFSVDVECEKQLCRIKEVLCRDRAAKPSPVARDVVSEVLDTEDRCARVECGLQDVLTEGEAASRHLSFAGRHHEIYRAVDRSSLSVHGEIDPATDTATEAEGIDAEDCEHWSDRRAVRNEGKLGDACWPCQNLEVSLCPLASKGEWQACIDRETVISYACPDGTRSEGHDGRVVRPQIGNGDIGKGDFVHRATGEQRQEPLDR
ncbi:DUF1484 family protein [Parvularcula lutaonensis]|uniref:DUF1484 family protein n=1 Tax=Parvularcula lutaonensis TaxID=491923 RepID=A0ABV7MDF9_9PROT